MLSASYLPSTGFDGGQRQWFMLELYDDEYGLLQANVSSRFPVFNIDGLEPDRGFKLVVYAANVKGRSTVVVLEANTSKETEKSTMEFGESACPCSLCVRELSKIIQISSCICFPCFLCVRPQANRTTSSS